MVRRFVSVAAVVVALALVGHAHASVINYDESIDGDLAEGSNGSALPTTLALGIGINTVAGTSGREVDSDDFDSFAFTVPTGATLVSLTLEVSQKVGNVRPLSTIAWSLREGDVFLSGTELHFLDISVPGSDSTPMPPLPLLAGTYSVQASSFSHPSGFQPALGDYVFTLEVKADNGVVPEPTTFAVWSLLGLTLGGVSWWRRRR